MLNSAEIEALPQRAYVRGKRRGIGGSVGEQAAADQTVVEPAGTVAGSVETQQLTQQLGNLSHHDEQFSMPTMPAYRSAAVGEHKFEYLDHTADVQLHAWGSTLQQAFEQVGLAMFNYMTPIDDLVIDEACTRDISVTGHDMQSLLFAYLDELLFVYSTEYIMMKHIHISSMDTQEFSITATGHGEKFNRQRHECGTEVKAITYSAMQIRQAEGDAEVFVIVDI